MRRLQAARITPSIPFVHKKLDDFGKDFDKEVMNCIQSECRRLEKITIAKETPGSVTRNLPSSLEDKIDLGRKVIFDNIDYEQKVHHMTEEHQNTLVHWTTYMSTENRVTGKYQSHSVYSWCIDTAID